MSVLVVIPARFASARYPGKPLAELRGASGISKSLVRRSWEAAIKVTGVSKVVVATDDERIKTAATTFGAQVVMTSAECHNGTERCADAIARLDESYDIVVNLQGDAPLTPSWFVEELVASLRAHPEAHMATPVLRCDAQALNGFLEDRRNGRVGGTTAVFDKNMRALYFSKEVIPYTPRAYKHGQICPVFHHVGVYAYRPDSLREYNALPEGMMEKLEGLEQLRFLENGLYVHCVEVDGHGQAFWELNNPEDVPKIERMLSDLGIE
jgi:3-deoxy-manno-octulosonate cytidylyltransferase (CMP-KDO synthetase)